jgi:L-lactate dehydrogenase complex protein LldF
LPDTIGLKDNIRKALADERLRAAVLNATDHSIAKRDEVVAEMPRWEELREEAARRRDRTLAKLDEHLLTLERNASAKGIRVHWAVDAVEANRIIGGICRETTGEIPRIQAEAEGGRPLIVKSKSMTTEEIGLTPYLERSGYEVVETDLGEYIVQISGQMPSHITAPALHLSRQDIGKLFSEKLGVDYEEDPEKLISYARRFLREKFIKADIGITGANFAIAETGTPMMVENEGNGRFVGAVPKTQIIVMGIEKVAATWDDLMIYLELLPRSATGQRITGSVLLFNRPRENDDPDGPEEMHLVIVDNGRSRALADPELCTVLRCIRCGACLNVCPVYRRVGGHAYGWVYPGPIGEVLAPLLLGLDKAPDHPFACSLCGRCTETCPVKIPLHHQLLTLRSRVVDSARKFSGEKAAVTVWKSVMDRPDLYRLLSRAPRFLTYDVLRGKSPKLPAWSKEHDGPEIAPRSFADLFRREFEEKP